jgi:hypothetical protein
LKLFMEQTRKQSAWTVLAVAVVLLAVLLMLVPNPHHLAIVMAAPVWAVVFLFGLVLLPSLPTPVSEEMVPQSPDLPSRFQRPPPSSL